MKKIVLTGVVLGIALFGMGVNAQSKYKKATTTAKPAANGQAPANAPAPAAAPATTPAIPVTGTSKYLNNNAATPAPAGTTATPSVSTPVPAAATLSVRYDTTIPGGFDTKQEVSLRPNYAVERGLIKDRKPLAYDHLREDDQVWSQFVWEEIDGREKINQSFVYPGKDDNGDQRFFAILLSAIKNDSVVAFSTDNDQFKVPLTADQINNLTIGANDTVDVSDPISGVVERVITKKPKFPMDSVYTFRIKEQFIFDKEASRVFCRIIGICPIAKRVVNGKSQPYPLFWIYYPDLRATLVKWEVYNPKNFAQRMSWEELFENRFFSSYVIKSTINNPGDKYLNALIRDPLFRLLEGQNIKEKIFNYEQDLWQY